MTHLCHDDARADPSRCPGRPEGCRAVRERATPSRQGSPARIPDGSGRSPAGTPVTRPGLRPAPSYAQNRNVTSGRLASLVAALALLTVPVLAGCGGDDETTSEDWAGGVCSEFSTWVTSVEDTIRSLVDQGLDVDRAAVEDAVDDIRGATDDLFDGLGDLDQPETGAAADAQSELDDLETELRQQADEVEEAVQSGPLALATVTTAISAAAAAVTAAFESLQALGGELQDAFESADDCTSFREQLEETDTGG